MGGLPVSPRDISSRSDISADSIERNGGRELHRDQVRWLEDLRNRGAKIVQVTYPRTANNDKELTVIRGEYLEVRLITKEIIFLFYVVLIQYTIVIPSSRI